MSRSFRAAQRELGENAALIAVHAVFGLRQPVDIGWEAGAGAMALVHNANGTGGVSMMSEAGELLQAVNAKPGSTLAINGVQIDLSEDLGLLCDTLTVAEDELELLG